MITSLPRGDGVGYTLQVHGVPDPVAEKGTMSTYYGNARAPKHMIVRQIRDLEPGQSALFNPAGIIVMRDTLEMFIDMEYETDQHIDWDENVKPDTIAKATMLDDEGRVEVAIYGKYWFRPVDSFPVDSSEDFRAVHKFSHYIPDPEPKVEQKPNRWGIFK